MGRFLLAATASLGLAACQPALDFLAHAGDGEIVWPLPPEAARLRYEGALDVTYGPTPPLRTLAGVEESPSFLQIPWRVAARDSLFAIVERERGTVLVHNRAAATSFFLRDATGAAVLTGARDAAFDEFHRLYVAEGAAGRVAIYEDNGRLRARFGSNLLWRNPARLALDAPRQRLYVADEFLNSVFVFSTDGTYLFRFGEHGDAPGQLNGLADIAVDPQGDVLTLEATARRLQVFDPQGKLKRVLPVPPDALVQPVALAVGANGTLYIADHFRESLVILDGDGRPLLTLGGLGRGPGKFDGLSDLAYDAAGGRLYSCETGFPRIQIFRRTAAPWKPAP